MADDITLKVTVETTEAKQKLAEVDKQVAKLGSGFTAASSTAVQSFSGAAASAQSFFGKLTSFGGDAIRALGGVGAAATAVGSSLVQAFSQRFIPTDLGQNLAMIANGAGVSLTALSALAAGIVAVGAAITASLKYVIDYGSEIYDLSLRTGLTTQAVQEYGFAAKLSGASVNDLAKASNQLAKNVAEGGTGTVAALRTLGLTLADVREMSETDRFIAIADALQEIEDHTTLVATGTALMGRGFDSIIPAIKEGVGDARDRFRALNLEMSEGTVRAADAAGDSLTEVWEAIKALAGTIVSPLLPAITGLNASIAEDAGRVKGWVESVKGAVTRTYEWGQAIGEALIGKVTPATVKQAEATDFSSRAAKVNLEALGGIKNIYGVLDQQLKASTETVKAHTKAVQEIGLSYRIGWEGAISSTTDATRVLKQEFYDLQAAVTQALESLPTKSKAVLATLSADAAGQGAVAGMNWGAMFGQAISVAIQGAFQGGGNIGQSVGGAIGGMLGTKAGEAATGALGSGILGSIAGSVLPGLGTALGGLVGGGLGKLFGAMFKTEGRQVNNLRDEFIEAAGGLDALNKKADQAGMTLNALLNAKKVDEFNAAVKDLNDGFSEQEQKLSRLQGLLEKYGLTWADVSQKARDAQMAELAGRLQGEMNELIDAGVGYEKTIESMAKAWSQLALVAIASGAKIPDSLMPIFQQLDSMGLLLDANGNKIEGIADLFSTWGPAAAAAANDIERNVNGIQIDPVRIPVEWQDPGAPVFASTGGYLGANGLQYLARGGTVLPFQPRGSDTVPAMLTPGEFVLSRDATNRIGVPRLKAINRGQSASLDGATVTVNVPTAYFDSPSMRRQFMDMVRDEMARELRQRRVG